MPDWLLTVLVCAGIITLGLLIACLILHIWDRRTRLPEEPPILPFPCKPQPYREPESEE